MITLAKYDQCYGCNACFSACPAGAITMVQDAEGFFYPRINDALCTQCGKCARICPSLHKDAVLESYREKNTGPTAFACYNKDADIRWKSSSGGVFHALAQAVINEGGIVFGAAFDKDFRVIHAKAESLSQLEQLRGSKYSQSEMGPIFRDVSAALETGRKVLFCGNTCQIGGLKAYLVREYDNLYCADLICLGVPSPMIWKKYVKYFLRKNIEAINFKEKSRGWDNFSFYVKYPDTARSAPGKNNLFMKGYFRRYYVRPSCFSCMYKTLDRGSDLTMADAWGISYFAPELFDNKGCSSIILYTEKGTALFESIKASLECKEVDVQDVIKYNSNAVSCVKKNPLRKAFYFFQKNLFRPTMILFCNNLYGICKDFALKGLRKR